jgi:hypothetical protein
MTIGGTTAGAAEFKGITTVSNATDATSPTAAAFKVSGGAAVSLKLVVGGNGYIGDAGAGTGFSGSRLFRVSNMINDSAADARVLVACDLTQLTFQSNPRSNSTLPNAAVIQAVTGGTGNGLFITSTGDDTSYVKLGAGSTAYTSPSLTIKKSDSAASSKTTGAVLVSGDMGVSGDIWTTVLHGTATAAQYQDVAEKYVPDAEYLPGTVVSFGGEKEITLSTTEADTAIAGVISTDPGYMMGSEIEGGVYVALLGRVPCKVVGTIKKGDLIVSSGIPGVATSYKNLQPGSPPQGSVIGKALENYDNFDQIGVIEVVVGRV